MNGTSSEPSTLTVAERNRLVDVALETVNGKITVVAATGSQSFAETSELTRHATQAGADAILVVTPYYVRPSQAGMVDYFVAVAELTDRPLMMYHIPVRTAFTATIETLEQIVHRAPNFVGMKHASMDFSLVTHALQNFGFDFRVFVGLEEYTFPMMCIGARGTMNAAANVTPARIAALCNAVLQGEIDVAKRLHFELFELNQSIFFDTNPIPIKYMLRKMGLLHTNEHRLPMISASPELESRLDGVLARAGLLS